MLKQYSNDYSSRIAFSNNFTIGAFFNIKDRMPDALCSHVVYGFSCPTCHSGYVGSTSRNLIIRTCEHRGISFRTNRQFISPSISNIRSHSLTHDHVYENNYFKILYKARDIHELRLAESLLIHKNRPSLNDYGAAVQLQVFPWLQ